MEMAEEYANERTTTITCEPLPPYDSDGEANSSPPPSGQATGPRPRPITARRAQRRELWKQRIFVLENVSVFENESRVVGPTDEDLTTKSMRTWPPKRYQAIRREKANTSAFAQGKSSYSPPPAPRSQQPSRLPSAPIGVEQLFESGRTPPPAMGASTSFSRLRNGCPTRSGKIWGA